MSYAKFDDPVKGVAQAARKIHEAIPVESVRRALQSISNRVLGGTSGTAIPYVTAGLAAGGTGGVQIANTVIVVINGIQSTCIAQNNLELPTGTQGANTVSRYLVSTGTGTSGTVTGPGNEAATAALAKLPDCPDGHCALGYVQINSHPTVPFVRTNAAISGTTGTGSYQDFISMPYDG